MTELIYKDAVLSVNAVDLSDHVKSATLTLGVEAQDDTAMGDNTRSAIAGLKTWSLEVEFHQDFAASQVDATLHPLIGAAAFAISVKPTSGAVSATNPNYNGNVILASYVPMSGAVGVLLGATASFQAAGDLTRATS